MSFPALFLDRDGVINEDTGYVHCAKDIVFMDGIFDVCRHAQTLGYRLIVVTNQAGIGRGYYSLDQFHDLTQWIHGVFLNNDIVIHETFFCPDHPEHGLGAYKKESPDRKPNPGMLLKAIKKYDLDPAVSMMIGDRESDMQAAKQAGVAKKILIAPQKPEKTLADYYVETLKQVLPLF